MERLYFALPMWLSALILLVVFATLCVGGHMTVRRLLPKQIPRQETELAAALMTAISAFIGFMLAFFAIQVWGDYTTADRSVSAEAASAAQLYRDLAVYGEESLPARRALVGYVKTVVEDEWPAMAEHQDMSPKTAATLVVVFRDIAAIEPLTSRETMLYGEALKKLNEVVEHRRARLLAAREDLPPVFWLVALIGSAIIVGYTFVYPDTRMNQLLIAGLAVSLGLIFVFILDVEHPYRGEIRVQPTEMRQLLPLFDQLDAAVRQGGG
jgi:hypothetical protein